jgi:membrane associated rhomboid family serine protease
MALFVPTLERRLGAVPALLLLVACGALGALAAPGLDDVFGDGFTLAAGGNGIALGALGAWVMLRRADARDDPTEELDTIPVVVAAAVLLLLPLVNDYANEWSGLIGGLVGVAAGFSATLGRR